MKKILALILAAAMLFALAACTGNTSTQGNEGQSVSDTNAESTADSAIEAETSAADAETTEAESETSAAPQAGNTEISKAVDILNTVWATYGDAEKFPVAGGDMENSVMDAPGTYALTDAEAVEATLGFPQADIALIDDAASLMHMMNANTFTCGVYHLTDSANMSKVSDSLKTAISGKQWMCGFPDTLIIISVGSDYILSAYGNAEIIENFKTKVLASYSGSAVLLEEVPLAA